MFRKIIPAALALLLWPVLGFAYVEYKTPAGGSVAATVMMLLNGSGEPVPVSAANPIPVASGAPAAGGATPVAGTASTIGVSPTNIVTGPVHGCYITNPLTAADQNIATAEIAYVNPVTGVTANGRGTNSVLQPGQTYSCPPGMSTNLSAMAPTNSHGLSVVVW